MNVLCLGGYTRRFFNVVSQINPGIENCVTELCFGDVYIAQWSHDKGLEWTGFDINHNFVNFAKGHGYDARLMDLRGREKLPRSDVVVLIGSLYHFHDILDSFVDKVMSTTDRFLISEPIKTLSNAGGIIQWIAHRAANASHGNERFRYTDVSLFESLTQLCKEKYFFEVLYVGSRDMIVELKWR